MGPIQYGLLILTTLITFAAQSPPPPQAQYNILFLSGFSSPSHVNIYQAVAESLSDRGHHVTLVTSQPPRKAGGGKIKEIQLKSVFEVQKNMDPKLLMAAAMSNSSSMMANMKI